MTRIDFYVLNQNTLAARTDYACRIVEKAVKNQCKVNILTDHANDSSELDEKLWSFAPESFVPHINLDALEENQLRSSHSSVNISRDAIECDDYDLLVNLSGKVPTKFSRYNRLIEIVVQDSKVLETTRKQHHYYKERGYPIFVHKIS